MEFANKKHREFCIDCVSRCKRNDAEHQALFYLMGLDPDLRENVDQWFNFKMDTIKPEILTAYWQSKDSLNLTRLAFNLWNGYQDHCTHPLELFGGLYGHFMINAIKLRFPNIEKSLGIVKYILREG